MDIWMEKRSITSRPYFPAYYLNLSIHPLPMPAYGYRGHCISQEIIGQNEQPLFTGFQILFIFFHTYPWKNSKSNFMLFSLHGNTVKMPTLFCMSLPVHQLKSRGDNWTGNFLKSPFLPKILIADSSYSIKPQSDVQQLHGSASAKARRHSYAPYLLIVMHRSSDTHNKIKQSFLPSESELFRKAWRHTHTQLDADAHKNPALCLWWQLTAGNIWMCFSSVYISKMLKN